MADLAEPIEKGSPADMEASYMYLAELCLGVSANRHSSFVEVIVRHETKSSQSS